MKRDMDLIRAILQKVESCEDPYGLEHMPEIDGYSRPQISYHMKLLSDAGLVEAQTIDEMGTDCADFMLINLTWQGQDFLDAAKDETLWKKAKETVIKPGASFTFDILLAWLKSQVGTALGLPI
jgi:DNA-binding transcriptional ArsR family regulator